MSIVSVRDGQEVHGDQLELQLNIPSVDRPQTSGVCMYQADGKKETDFIHVKVSFCQRVPLASFVLVTLQKWLGVTAALQ